MAKKEKKPVFKEGQLGRRIRTISPYMGMTPFIMKDRNDATNNFSDTIEITEADKFLRQKRLEGMKGMGFLHLFIAAYVRTVSQYPALNRYITGQRVYARNGIIVVMTVKKSMDADSEETSIKVRFEPSDTIYDVYNKMTKAIDEVKNGNETATGDLAGIVMKLPRLIIRFIVSFLNLLDYFNIMPRFVHTASPFHGSMIITDMGSLGIPPIYHHLYNFGNLPVFIAFGMRRRVSESDMYGNVHERRYIDFTVVTDERICDGYNYAQCLKMMRSFMRHPQQLETPPEVVKEDIY